MNQQSNIKAMISLEEEEERKPRLQNRRRDDDKLNSKIIAFVGELQSEARRRVGRRVETERRWLKDLRQYHGIYEPEVQEKLKASNKSMLFNNQTRPKTNAMSARLIDLLFPTDDKNWGIAPTPVPSLAKELEDATTKVDDARGNMEAARMQAEASSTVMGPDGQPMQNPQAMQAAQQAEDEYTAAEEYANKLADIMKEASKRADLMEEEIDDQFKACSYQAQCRDMIEDSCKIGTGVIKGPIIGERMRKRWAPTDTGEQELNDVADNQPAYYRVDPWSFFPDPDERDVDKGEGVMERHLLNEKMLRRLARRPDMDQDALRNLIRKGPTIGDIPHYLAELSNITGERTDGFADRYHVWEYRGPVGFDQLHLLADAFEDEGIREDLDGYDPLTELNVTVWFCDDEILSFAVHPLDSGETLYSVFSLEKDETSPFGYGIPTLMRDDQSANNAAWRMMLDNGGIATGPQIVVNEKLIEPEDGEWEIVPFKIWKQTATEPTGTRPFQLFDVNMNQTELANIIQLSRENIDDSTSMPAMAQGEQGAGVTKTAQGMAMLMNSANVVFRRVVKNFDDDVTVPNVRRAYDWNMQFSEKEEIKGDYDIDARGSSVLLVREMQANNLMMIALQFGGHEIYGPMTKHSELYRSVVKAHGVAVDEVVKTDREMKREAQESQEQPDPMALAQQEANQLKRDEIDSKVQIANMERQTRLEVAKLQRQVAMETLAEKLNMTTEQLIAKIEGEKVKAEQKDRSLAVETAMAQRTGQHAGGAI